MPNWCEGNFKLRGSFENLVNFVKDNLLELERVSILEDKLKPLNIEGGEDCMSCELPKNVYLKDSRRFFIEDDYIELDKRSDKEDIVLVLESKVAWGLMPEHIELFLMLAKQYQLDIKFYGFEMGMQFVVDFECNRNGEIITSEEITYDDWDWECIMPKMGG